MAKNNLISFMSFKDRGEAVKTAMRYRSRGGIAVVKKTNKNMAFPFEVFTSK